MVHAVQEWVVVHSNVSADRRVRLKQAWAQGASSGAFSLDSAPAESAAAPVTPIDSSNSGLHERLYQTATVHFSRRRVGSEEFQEGFDVSGDSSGLNDSGAGLWASGRNESGLGGVAPRQRSMRGSYSTRRHS